MSKGVIFDLDGTLLDTLNDLAGSVNAALRGLGYPEHQEEAYKLMVGNGFANLMERALPEDARTEANVEKMLAAFTADYHTRYCATTVPYPGIPELLAELTEAGIKLAINSNKRDDYTKALIELHFPEIPFVMVLGGRKDIPKKPDPASVMLIAETMMLSPEDIVCIGDSSVDIETAKNAGMPSIGVLWGFRDEAELKTAGADRIAQDTVALREILRNQREY